MEKKQVAQLAFTYREAAEAAGVSVGLIRKLAASGKLQVVKINRCARIPRHSLLRLCGASAEKRGAE